MQAPKLPSFFKAPNSKYFSFKPRYYNENKERREQLLKEEKSTLKSNAQNRLISELSQLLITTSNLGWTLKYDGKVIEIDEALNQQIKL